MYSSIGFSGVLFFLLFYSQNTTIKYDDDNNNSNNNDYIYIYTVAPERCLDACDLLRYVSYECVIFFFILYIIYFFFLYTSSVELQFYQNTIASKLKINL